MKMPSYLIVLFLVTGGTLQTFASEVESSEEIILFAATSTLQAVEVIKVSYKASHPNIKIRVSYGASALLAKQISKGAPADLFLSANKRWIDWLGEAKASISAPVIIAQNRLMLISSASSSALSCPPSVNELREAIGNKRFIIADPNISPLGQYSKEALMSLGLWQSVEKQLAIAGNATLALKMIERGAAPYGIAYASSAKGSAAISHSCLLATSNHSPINYYLVATKAPSQATSSFTQYLSHKSRQHWQNAGFEVLHQNDTVLNESK